MFSAEHSELLGLTEHLYEKVFFQYMKFFWSFNIICHG